MGIEQGSFWTGLEVQHLGFYLVLDEVWEGVYLLYNSRQSL